MTDAGTSAAAHPDADESSGGTDYRARAAGLAVLSVPDYRDSNPYQAALAASLESLGVSVRSGTGPGHLLPLTRLTLGTGVPDVFHVHFLAPYFVVGDRRLHRLGLAAPLALALGLRLLLELWLLRLLGATTVWTVHDLVNHERRHVRVERFVKHVAARFLVDRLIVHCDEAGAEFRRTFGLPVSTRRKFVVIPHGHFLDAYPDTVDAGTARGRLGLDAAATVFLFFGWIRPYKNVPRLVEQFKRLDGDAARLLVVGSPRTEQLAARVRAAAAGDDRIRLVLEFVSDDEVQLYMNAADVVVLPFRTAGRSLLTSGSVVLAMGFENAVVAPAIGCIDELLDDAGGVCYDATDDALQPLQAMRDLLDVDLEAMGRYNRRQVERLDWDGIARRTLRTYLDGMDR